MKTTNDAARGFRSPAALCCLLGSLLIAACASPDLNGGSDLDPTASDGVQTAPGGPDIEPRRDAGASTPPSTPSSSSTPAPADAGNADAADAALAPKTFPVSATDCNGGYCRAGYDGTKDPTELSTASKKCVDHGFARAAAFTSTNSKPGGKFCSFTNGAYHCDNSCSGCNPMGTIDCVTP